MSKRQDRNMEKVIDLTQQMIHLADMGESQSLDDGRALLYGIVRDCAWRIRKEVQREQASHPSSDSWEEKV